MKFISDRTFDFIIAIGDDKTDEDIYRLLPPEAVTIKIGITSSIAKYNLATQNDVSRIIAKLIRLKTIIASGHTRLPVISDEAEPQIVGILHAFAVGGTPSYACIPARYVLNSFPRKMHFLRLRKEP